MTMPLNHCWPGCFELGCQSPDKARSQSGSRVSYKNRISATGDSYEDAKNLWAYLRCRAASYRRRHLCADGPQQSYFRSGYGEALTSPGHGEVEGAGAGRKDAE